MRSFILVLLFVLSGCTKAGCGKGIEHSMQAAHSGIEMTWEMGYVPITKMCREKAKACGKQVCKAWLECDKVRAQWAKAAKAASLSLVVLRDALMAAQNLGLLK